MRVVVDLSYYTEKLVFVLGNIKPQERYLQYITKNDKIINFYPLLFYSMYLSWYGDNIIS